MQKLKMQKGIQCMEEEVQKYSFGGTFWSTSRGFPSRKQSKTVSILSRVAANPPQG
jgi:hypothetical protein